MMATDPQQTRRASRLWVLAAIMAVVLGPFVLFRFPPACDFPSHTAIAAVLFALSRRGLFHRKLMAVMAVLYAPGRFLFDFLRASDVPYRDARYFGLTPGQYFCFILAAWGLYVLARPGATPSPAPAPAASGERVEVQAD